MDENNFLNQDEFLELSDASKWQYIQSLMKIIKDLKILAEKNCLECENNMLTNTDVNIDLYFEDWRNCAENCDECTKDDQIAMCETQFNLINHIANSLGNLEDKFNALVKIVLSKNQNGFDLIEEAKKELKKNSNHSKEAQSMFQ